MSEEQQLIVVDETNALDLFTKEGGLDFIIEEARNLVDGFEHDLSTDTGRKKTASLAHKIARFKVRLDGMGKDLVSDWKAKAKKVDESRKHVRDELDKLKEIARQPLTEWEEAEKGRVAAHRERLQELVALIENESEESGVYAVNLATAKAIEMGDRWEEFAAEAAQTKDRVVAHLEAALDRALKREEEQAELERLRKEEEERKERERIEAIEREAAAKAKAEAEAKAEEERKAAEEAARQEQERVEAERQEAQRREQEAKEAAEKAERERIAAEERAKIEAEQAEKRQAEAVERAKREEAARIQAEKERAEAEERERSEKKRHANKIKNQAAKGLVAAGLSEEDAKKAVEAIVAGTVPHTTIRF